MSVAIDEPLLRYIRLLCCFQLAYKTNGELDWKKGKASAFYYLDVEVKCFCQVSSVLFQLNSVTHQSQVLILKTFLTKYI